MTGWADCSAETIWPNAEELVRGGTILFAINRGGPGPGGLDTKSPVYATAPDPLRVSGYTLCLCRWVDGSPITIRYRQSDIKTAETPSEIKILNYFYHKGASND